MAYATTLTFSCSPTHGVVPWTVTMSGRLTRTSNGLGISGATIIMQGYNGSSWQNMGVSAVTNSSGNYTVSVPLTAANGWVAGESQPLRATYAGNTTYSPVNSSSVTVTMDSSVLATTLTMTCTPTHGSVPLTVTFAGRLTDSTGAGVAGATIIIENYYGSNWSNMGVSGVTDASGNYSIITSLTAEEGWIAGTVEDVRVSYAGDATHTASVSGVTTLTIDAITTTGGLTFVCSPTHGVVPWLLTMSGKLTNSSGVGIAGATVVMQGYYNGSWNDMGTTAVTDSSGNYIASVTLTAENGWTPGTTEPLRAIYGDAISNSVTVTMDSSPSAQFVMRATDVPIDIFTPNHANYRADAWQQLEAMNINLIRLLPEVSSSGFCRIGVDAAWAQNLENLLAAASSHGMKVTFMGLGAKYDIYYTLLNIIPYGQYGGETVASAKAKVDQLAGNNALGHNFITDPRVWGWVVSNEQDMAVSGSVDWNIQILDYIRSKGGRAWVSAPYQSGVGYLDAPQYLAMFDGHVDMIELHDYGEWEYVYHANKDLEAFTNIMIDIYQNKYLSTSWGPDKIFYGEFGCWRGYGSNEGFVDYNFTDADRVAVYTGLFNAMKAVGLQNVCFHYLFGVDNHIPDYGVLKPNNQGTGYWDENLADIIKTNYSVSLQTTVTFTYTSSPIPVSATVDGVSVSSGFTKTVNKGVTVIINAPLTFNESVNPPSSSLTPIKAGANIYGLQWDDAKATDCANKFPLIVMDWQGERRDDDMKNISYAPYVSKMKTVNPTMKVVGYKDCMLMHTVYADFPTVDTHEEWFMHDANNNRITLNKWSVNNSGYQPYINGVAVYDNVYLMDIGNAGWRQHYLDIVNSKMSINPQYDGAFLDDVWTTFRTGEGWSSLPTSAKISSWHSDMLGMLQFLKANLASGKLLMGNTDSGWTYLDTWNSDYLNVMDGHQIEGFMHAPWDEQVYWDLEQQIVCLQNSSANGKYSFASSGNNTTNATLQKYCYCCYLLGVNGPNARWAWAIGSVYYDTSVMHPAIMNTDLGNPIGTYYTSGSGRLRKFDKGIVACNLSGSTITVNLGGTYKLADGTVKTSVTLAAHSGEILYL